MEKKDTKDMFMKVSQIGLVVRDIEKVSKEIERILGVKPTGYGETPKDGKQYHGKDEDFCAKLAFYHFGNMEVELIQPLYGKSVWQDFLDSGREGLHHIRFSIDSFQDVKDTMEGKGIELTMEGQSVRNSDLRWGYYDTEDAMKFIIEVFNEFEVEGK